MAQESVFNSPINYQAPSRAIVLELLQEANWAPTADNVQNWKLRADEGAFEVRIDTERWDHPIDPEQHASLVSLGAFTEALIIAAAARGYLVDFDFDPENLSVIGSLQVKEEPGETHLSGLAPFLPHRRTDRRSYQSAKIPPELNEALLRNSFPGIQSHTRSKVSLSREFFSYLEEVDLRLWHETDAMLATLKYINFDDQRKYGFSYQSAGLNFLEAHFVKRLGQSPELFAKVLDMGLRKLASRSTSKNYKKSAGFLLITAEQRELVSFFSAGRQAMQNWLELTRSGWTAQPLTLSSLSLFQLHLDVNQSGTVKNNLQFFKEGEVLVRQQFELKDEETPLWLLRIGPAPPISEAYITPRMDVGELILKS